MNITGIIKTLLDADSSVYAVLGGRIFPAVVPEKTLLPCARVVKMATEPNETKDGASGHDFVHIQISVYAGTYKEAETANERIRELIDSFYGVVTTTDNIAHLIGRIVFQDSSDQYDDRPAIYHVSSDYVCRVTRNVNVVSWVSSGIVPYVTTVAQTAATLMIPSDTLVSKIVVLSSANTQAKCGTALNGDNVMKLKYGTANVPMESTVNFYTPTPVTLYFSGLAGNTRIVVYTA